MSRLLPRMCTVKVSTTDPTRSDDLGFDGKAVVFSWLGFTLEIQIAWESVK